MIGKVIYEEQEQSSDCVWIGVKPYMTSHFRDVFGDKAEIIIAMAVALIMKNHPTDADYFQVFRYLHPDGKETKFWIINDIDHYTALLPSDY